MAMIQRTGSQARAGALLIGTARVTNRATRGVRRRVRLPDVMGRLYSDSLHSPLIFIAGFTLYWPIAAVCDSLGGGLPVQQAIGALTWLVLVAGIWHAPPSLCLPAISMVVVATVFECIGSLLWGAYRYRYHNLPLYVPPGHGLFYLSALQLSALPWIRRHARRIVALVAIISAVWALRGLFAGTRPDLLGAWCWFLLTYFLCRGRDPLLFAVTFTLTMLLEFVGTSLGCWQWAAVLPHTHISAGNPPSAIGAGYCVLDALAVVVATQAAPLLRRLGEMTLAGKHVAPPTRRSPARGQIGIEALRITSSHGSLTAHQDTLSQRGAPLLQRAPP